MQTGTSHWSLTLVTSVARHSVETTERLQFGFRTAILFVSIGVFQHFLAKVSTAIKSFTLKCDVEFVINGSNWRVRLVLTIVAFSLVYI
jgi:hypothetical protein